MRAWRELPVTVSPTTGRWRSSHSRAPAEPARERSCQHPGTWKVGRGQGVGQGGATAGRGGAAGRTHLWAASTSAPRCTAKSCSRCACPISSVRPYRKWSRPGGQRRRGPPQLLTLSPDGRLPMSLSPQGPGQDGLGHRAARGPHGTRGLRARDATPSVWQMRRRCVSQAGEGTGPRSSAWPCQLRRHPARPRLRYLCPRAPRARPPWRTRRAWPRRHPAGRTGRPAPSPRPSQRSAAFLPGAGPWGPRELAGEVPARCHRLGGPRRPWCSLSGQASAGHTHTRPGPGPAGEASPPGLASAWATWPPHRR